MNRPCLSATEPPPVYASRKMPKVGLQVDLSLCEGLEKLRVTSIRTTFDAFAEDRVGMMVQAFYGCVLLLLHLSAPQR